MESMLNMEKSLLALSKDDLLEMVNYMVDETEEIDDLTEAETLELIGLIQDAISDVISRFGDDLREARFDS